MATSDSTMLRQCKADIDDGFATSFSEGMALEVTRSAAHAQNVMPESVEASRSAVTEHGRGQNA